MPPFGPVKRRKLIQNLRKLGFEGPYSGGNHQFMVKGDLRLVIPNPHKGDISRALLSRILKQAGITREEWERL
ncbi:MAG TPA: type II toxin-antitoxin system HicA family toxin [Chloroflexi bacterium]|nr:type II toxin-antitoxin system HicA family toxin [Chloroflexota bacterium]